MRELALVSFQTRGTATWYDCGRLVVIDAQSLEIVRELGEEHEPDKGIFGFGWCRGVDFYKRKIVAAGYYYVLLIDYETFTVERCFNGPWVDLHSLKVVGDVAFVVSTGTDRVVTLDLTSGETSVLWSGSSEEKDIHHYNSITLQDGEFILTYLGEYKGKTGALGGVINISSGENMLVLFRPHNYTPASDGYYINLSERGECLHNDEVIYKDRGWFRGLGVLRDGKLLLGDSPVFKEQIRPPKVVLLEENQVVNERTFERRSWFKYYIYDILPFIEEEVLDQP